MTDEERRALSNWRQATADSQPREHTLSLLVYVSDGKVHLIRDLMRHFPTDDIPVAKQLIVDFLDEVYARDHK